MIAKTYCKACNIEIEWATKHGGGGIPLQRIRSYKVNTENHATPAGEVLVHHVPICPKKMDLIGEYK